MKPRIVEGLGCAVIFVAMVAFPLVCYRYPGSFPLLLGNACAACFIGLLMLLAGLALRKATPRTRTAVRLGLGALVAGLLMGWMYWDTRPNQLFRNAIADPIPQGVSVLHGEYGPESVMWLHFIVPDGGALALVQERTPFEEVGEDDRRDPQQVSAGLTAPDWWRPAQLDALRAYRYENLQDGIWAWFYTDGQDREAYYHSVSVGGAPKDERN
ncbi:MAG TPA: hypothetical protein PLP01_17130 [Phycisphaerae bacterium]|nr:hypothetical protein [Phycisphaerae bacterium]HOI56978.1 hypothetical protein [Phycisphaerae bacterium]